MDNQNFLAFISNKISETYSLKSSVQFNNAILENQSDSENVIHSKYYGVDDFKQLRIPFKEKSPSLFLIRSCSLNKNFEELQNLVQSANIHFPVTAITETQIPKMFL